MLLSIAHDPEIKATDIAQEVGITERTVRAIIADLEKEHYLTKIKIGRGVKYSIKKSMPLRHKTMHYIRLSKLIALLE
jgi:predicted transcriptional regulator